MAGRGTCAIGLLAAAGALVNASATEAETLRSETPLQRDARLLANTTAELNRAIDRWRRRGDPTTGPPPRAVQRAALRQQRLIIRLSSDPRRAEEVVSRTRGRIRKHVRASMRARLVLFEMGLPSPQPLRSFRAGTPLPAGELLAYYREAQRRFGVGWHVLAAVNFVESGFGRIRTPSSAGALGPMQFMPPTWKAYGFGGDVFHARDAIIGAANYLRASGAPGDYWGALYNYNHSDSYVEAVLRYAGLMKQDIRAFYALYSWQVFVRTPSGLTRLAAPGARPSREVVKCCAWAAQAEPVGPPLLPLTPTRPRLIPRHGILQSAVTARDSPPGVRARANVRLLLAGPTVPATGERALARLLGRTQCCSLQAAGARTRQARAPPDHPGSAMLPSRWRAGTQSAAGSGPLPRRDLRPKVSVPSGRAGGPAQSPASTDHSRRPAS
jgi:soluble lytic murein transglycosylase-like protein